MKESDWLCQTTVDALIQHAAKLSKRKQRLWLAACCRRLWPLLPEVSRQAIEAAEAYADSTIKKRELKTARQTACSAIQDSNSTPAEYAAASLARGRVVAGWIIGRCACAMISRDPRSERAENAAQVALLRDIFGNPFRPVTFDPGSRTSTVLALAKQMYDSRDFSAMPILADALQDAGCENGDVLTHCRDAKGVHVRGCWVVDLVLGKS